MSQKDNVKSLNAYFSLTCYFFVSTKKYLIIYINIANSDI